MRFLTWNSLRRSSLAMLIMIGLVFTAAAIAAFTQTAPSTTIPPPPITMTPLCATVANFTNPTAGSGSVAYSCTGQVSAFTVTNGPAMATPTVHGLAPGLTLTFYSGAQNLNPCPGSSLSATILNNTAMNIGNGDYNYCVFYNNLTTGLTFNWNVNWK